MIDYCMICGTNEIDTNCTLNGRWKVGSRGMSNSGENRFNIHVCLPCFDYLAKESKE